MPNRPRLEYLPGYLTFIFVKTAVIVYNSLERYDHAGKALDIVLGAYYTFNSCYFDRFSYILFTGVYLSS